MQDLQKQKNTLAALGIMEPQEAEEIIDQIWSPLMDKVPSMQTSGFKKVQKSFSCRRAYISKFGYVLLSAEVLEELSSEFKKRNINSFIELGAGTGFLTKVLVDRGHPGIGYTLPIPSEPKENHWGLNHSEIYKFCLDNELIELGDIQNLENISIPDVIISAWVPYGGGQEVQHFFDANGYPEWYIVIGEGSGGCTANDEWHDWLDSNYQFDSAVSSYQSFNGIYDTIEFYKKKS